VLFFSIFILYESAVERVQVDELTRATQSGHNKCRGNK
jgi:hypothetical protein